MVDDLLHPRHNPPPRKEVAKMKFEETIKELTEKYENYLPSYYRYDSTNSLKLEVVSQNLENDIENNIDKGFSLDESAILAAEAEFKMTMMDYRIVEVAFDIVSEKYCFKKSRDDILRQAAFRCLAKLLGFPILAVKEPDYSSSAAPFPINTLPVALRDMVATVSDVYQVPLEMAGPVVLGVLSTACLKKFAVREMNGHMNPLCLYIAVSAESGERKSSTLAALTEVLRAYEQEFNRLHAADIEKTMLAERRLKCLKNQAGKREDAESQYLAAKAEFDVMDKVYPLRLAVDDTTMEALTQTLAKNSERGAIIAAEGGILDILAGRYSPKLNIDILLHAHCGEPHSVDRIMRPSETLAHPELAIVLAVQPDVVRAFVENPTFAGRGLLARFLFSPCTSRIGARHYTVDSIPAGTQKAYDDTIWALLEIPVPATPAVLEFSGDANNELTDYFDYFETILEEDVNRSVDGAAKHIGTVIRLAGLIHVVNDPAAAKPISDDELLKAIELGEFFRKSAESIFSDSACSAQQSDKAFVLKVVKKKMLAVSGKTDFSAAMRGRFRKAEQLDRVLRELAADGFLKIESEKSGEAGRPFEMVIVNPMLFMD